MGGAISFWWEPSHISELIGELSHKIIAADDNSADETPLQPDYGDSPEDKSLIRFLLE